MESGCQPGSLTVTLSSGGFGVKLHPPPEWCAQAGLGEGALLGDGALERSERVVIGDAGAGAETAVARFVGFGERVQ